MEKGKTKDVPWWEWVGDRKIMFISFGVSTPVLLLNYDNFNEKEKLVARIKLN